MHSISIRISEWHALLDVKRQISEAKRGWRYRVYAINAVNDVTALDDVIAILLGYKNGDYAFFHQLTYIGKGQGRGCRRRGGSGLGGGGATYQDLLLNGSSG